MNIWFNLTPNPHPAHILDAIQPSYGVTTTITDRRDQKGFATKTKSDS